MLHHRSIRNSEDRPPPTSSALLPWPRVLTCACSLALMWTFITLLAPAHALRNGSLFTGIVLRLSGNAASFAWLLSAALIPGILLDRLAGQYYRVITALALLALAVMAWEIICPLRHLAAFVNRCLTVDYFTTLRWTP